MIIFLTLWALGSAALVPLLLRDTKRADARRRRREWLRSLEGQRFAADWSRVKSEIGRAMLPAFAVAARHAIEMERQFAKLARHLDQLAGAARDEDWA